MRYVKQSFFSLSWKLDGVILLLFGKLSSPRLTFLFPCLASARFWSCCSEQVNTNVPESNDKDYGTAREYILDDDECPLAILMNYPNSRGKWSLHVFPLQRRSPRIPADYIFNGEFLDLSNVLIRSNLGRSNCSEKWKPLKYIESFGK